MYDLNVCGEGVGEGYWRGLYLVNIDVTYMLCAKMKDNLVTSTACTSPDVPSTPECSTSLAF